ncbi:ABC transporter [Phenylobacterium hankyongense]|uniref:ABC transporter n=1 Tax=Phenylobacterium hankyongense TaxID=1813876 RepID=A0A328B3F3_9CAUL|nr:ABC-type transport auxiliary lipoprotein family protein [Phenylobacterium hankyongense]RAK60971.1 ABC transporter [Phenylobacterium hankyongense]
MIRSNSLPTTLLRLAAVGACALMLSGCISLLPKSKPAQLYRFGQHQAPPATGPAAAGAAPIGVFRASGVFQQESAGDRILTITGEHAAYIAQARWVAPAAVLFDAAVLNAFDAHGGRARLVSRGEPAHSDYALRLDVRDFETRYESGEKAAPTVVVRVRAQLTRSQNNAVVGEQIFEARVPADNNRVGAIVGAYDKALTEVLGKVVAWTDGSLT